MKYRSKKKLWAIRALIVVAGSVMTIAVLWATGMVSQDWWHAVQGLKSRPRAVALPTHPNKPIGVPAPPAPRGNDSSVSVNPLPLILIQTSPGRNAHEGSAQIGVERDSPQTYQAGAVLENGARLSEIHPDHVLLEKDGRTAALYLQGNRADSTSRAPSLLEVGGVRQAPPSVRITDREVLTDYIRPSPVYDGASLVGYQIYAGAMTGPFVEMGLSPGDVITDIAGTPLNDPTIAWELLRQVASGSVMSAVVKRAGTLQDVTLDGTLIARAEEARAEKTQSAMLAVESP
jgi:Type II secretion system protein C